VGPLTTVTVEPAWVDIANLRGADIRNHIGSALSAERLQTKSTVLLDDESDAVGRGDNGTIFFSGARIGGGVLLSTATSKRARRCVARACRPVPASTSIN
jgi:hypothetical protein